MSAEQQKVLELLSQGKVTAEDAARLLEAIGEKSAQKAAAPPGETVSKLGEMFGKFFQGGAWGAGPAPEPHPGAEAVAAAEEGFDLPPGASLSIKAKGGSIGVVQADAGECAHLAGDGAARTVVSHTGQEYFADVGAGYVEFRIPPVRSLKLNLAGGNLELRGVAANVSAKIHGGSVSGKDCTGRFELKCMGGNVDLEGRVTGLDLNCMGGSAAVRGLGITEGQHRARCMGGNVRMTVLAEASVTIRAKAMGGSVNSDVPPSGGAGGFFGHGAEYKFGEGAGVLEVQAFGGQVDIQRD